MNQEFFSRGVAEIIEKDELEAKLKSGKKLRVKMGFDPTRPDLHLGHAVGLRKLRQLQDDGHTIVFIIGDYTTKIGDPSGKNKTRPVLTDTEIEENAKTYFEQVSKILNVEKTEVRYNSEWLSKLAFNDVLQLMGKFTIAQMIERDDFAKRLKDKSDIGMHELLYPIMQAYDSVMVKADVEFGGTDQKFNLLAGRQLQKKMGQTPQDIFMVDILVGLDGREKMSKSLGNYVGISEDAKSQFGKIMSIPDSLIKDYFVLCTDITIETIDGYMKEIDSGRNPKEIKEILAETTVEIYHNGGEARAAKEEFEKVFSKKELPSEMEELDLQGKMNLLAILEKTNSLSSKSEARRKIVEGAVKIDGQKVTDPFAELELKTGMVIQIGKQKYFKVK
jgi:tyrosyl-tRNA synthetase